MTALSTLRDTVRRYVNETNPSNSHFLDSEIDDYLNQAVTFLGTQMEWAQNTVVATVVTDQALYQLPDNFISLVDGYFDNNKLTVLERADLSGLNPNWQNDGSSIPRYAYKADNSVVGLYPPPDSGQSGKSFQIQYIQVPDTLSNDSDVPDLHVSFQMCLPFYAAFLCDYKLGNDKKSELHLKNYELHRKTLESKVQKYSDDLMRFRWSGRYA